MNKVTVIVPVHNEAEVLRRLYDEVRNRTAGMKESTFSWIFVDDGSTDASLEVIREMAEADRTVRYISFSRSFGKEAAIYAGLLHSASDLTILMDADLQHPPELIPEMVRCVGGGEADACGAKRRASWISRSFTRLINAMSTVKIESGATDFMCMNRKFVDAVLSLSESQRFSKGLFAWVGFRVRWLDYRQRPREAGRSKWNMRKLFLYALDGLTGFSVVPLRIISAAGAVVCLLAILYILVLIIRTLIRGIDVPGYVTTLVAVLFLGGVILLSVGVLGDYIGRIFMESKKRPLFITDVTNIGNEETGHAENAGSPKNNGKNQPGKETTEVAEKSESASS